MYATGEITSVVWAAHAPLKHTDGKHRCPSPRSTIQSSTAQLNQAIEGSKRIDTQEEMHDDGGMWLVDVIAAPNAQQPRAVRKSKPWRRVHAPAQK